MVNFCQHSEYSFLGSLLRLKDLVHFNAFQGYTACSISDTLSTYGYYSLTQLCQSKNIQPVYGITLFSNGVSGKGCYPIMLIANNNIGLSNIFKLNTLSHQKFEHDLSFKLNLNDLFEHKEGLTFIAEDEMITHIDNYSYLTQYFDKMKDLFFQQFYISINYTGHPKVEILKQVLELIQHYDTPGIANIESRYHHPDSKAFHYLNAYRQKHFKEDERGTTLNTDMDFSIRSSSEFNHLFSNHPHILENNARLLAGIDAHLDLDHIIPLSNEENQSKLERICELDLMNINANTEPYQNRLNIELDVVKRSGHSNIYLFLNSLLEYINKEHIPLSSGFGKNISSLIFYLFKQHSIDPLRHPLLSFTPINDYPHFTLDAGWKEKEKILEYIITHFGNTQVAHTSSITHIAGRTAIRDLAQVYPISKDDVNDILKHFPAYQSGSIRYIRPRLQQNLSLQNYIRNNPHLLEFLDICSRIEGLPAYTSAHSDTIIIVPQGVEKFATIEHYQNSRYLAQILKEDVEHNNILSLDIRGQRLTSVLYLLSRIIPFSEIPLDDKKVWSNISRWKQHSLGILENTHFKSLSKQVLPESIEQLASIFALQHNLNLQKKVKVKHYLNRFKGKEKPEISPYLTDILTSTFGIFLYEEQLRQLFKKIKGFPDQSNKEFFLALRNGDDDKVPFLKQQLQQACENEKLDSEFIQHLISLILEEAASLYPYSQAISQSYYSYYAVYYWTHYKREYYLHSLNNSLGYPVKLNDLIAECRTQGITLHGIDINKSDVYFTPEKDAIRCGLLVIKYLNISSCQQIVQLRKDRLFVSLVDFLVRTRQTTLSKRQREFLIKSGAFRFEHSDIPQLLQAYPKILHWIKDNSIVDKNQIQAFGLFQNNPQMKLPLSTEFIQEQSNSDHTFLDIEYIQESTELFLDKHPVHKYHQDLQKMDIDNLSRLSQLKYAVCAVYLYKLRIVTTKAGKEMAFASISDPSGLAEAVFFPGKYKKYIHVIKEKEMFLIKGETDGHKILVDEIYILDVVL